MGAKLTRKKQVLSMAALLAVIMTVFFLKTSVSATGEQDKCIYHNNKQPGDFQRVQNSLHAVPHSLWQTYRTDDLPTQAKDVAEAWLSQNPDYNYHFHNDEEVTAFLKEHFDQSTLDMVTNFPRGVMRADFWRYAIMYFYGGVYMDIDAAPLRPIREFKHYPFDDKKVVIGIENDEHLCQWAFISAPYHPLFANVIRVVRDVWEHDRRGDKRPPDYVDYVHNYTGPTIFTYAVMNFLGVSEKDVGSKYLARYLLDQYNTPTSAVRQRADEYGIVIEEQLYYQGGMIRHLFGSWSFGDGYFSWTSNTQKGQTRDAGGSNNIRNLISKYQTHQSYLRNSVEEAQRQFNEEKDRIMADFVHSQQQLQQVVQEKQTCSLQLQTQQTTYAEKERQLQQNIQNLTQINKQQLQQIETLREQAENTTNNQNSTDKSTVKNQTKIITEATTNTTTVQTNNTDSQNQTKEINATAVQEEAIRNELLKKIDNMTKNLTQSELFNSELVAENQDLVVYLNFYRHTLLFLCVLLTVFVIIIVLLYVRLQKYKIHGANAKPSADIERHRIRNDDDGI